MEKILLMTNLIIKYLFTDNYYMSLYKKSRLGNVLYSKYFFTYVCPTTIHLYVLLCLSSSYTIFNFVMN